jgi:hypothetical protein
MILQDILSIRLAPDGFSFSTYNVLEEDSFHTERVDITPGADFNARVKEEVYAREAQLLREYQECHCTVVTGRVTAVPASATDAEAEAMFRLVCAPVEEPEVLLHERHEATGVHWVYAMDEALHSFLTRTFQGVRLHHPLATLHGYFAEKCKGGNQAKMVAQIYPGDQQLLVYRKGRLQLANCYAEREPNDMLYYVLNTWTQCAMDNGVDQLLWVGDKQLLKELTAQVSPIVRETMPAVFPVGFFRLGQETLETPWDVLLLSNCQAN